MIHPPVMCGARAGQGARRRSASSAALKREKERRREGGREGRTGIYLMRCPNLLCSSFSGLLARARSHVYPHCAVPLLSLSLSLSGTFLPFTMPTTREGYAGWQLGAVLWMEEFGHTCRYFFTALLMTDGVGYHLSQI